ncbi:uncharacterized protein [Haliotis cracherodii]|uniref:uncharacterized protein isoform X3 n=1 Tax=Haliotis cracherodii TaxID=6455 RepID=UPI0039E9642C
MSDQEKKKSTEKSESGSKAECRIKRTAMSGSARAFNSNVSAVVGGSTEVLGDVHGGIIEEAMTGDAVAENCNIQAAKDHRTSIRVPVGDLDLGESDQAEAKECDLTFGKDTFVLLVSGAGDGYKTFKKDVQLMEALFMSPYFEISDDNIFKVTFKPGLKGKMIDNIKTEIGKICTELKDSTDGRLIVYYSGHFEEKRNYRIGSDDFMSDKTFSDMLGQIEAKFMLLILDTCHAGSAKMGAKGNEGANHGVPIPQLWKLIGGQSDTKGSKGGQSISFKHEKIVQWCSCKSEEKALYDKEAEISLFTKAIKDVLDGTMLRAAGTTHATVLQIHNCIKLSDQTPQILPDNAADAYFKAYPKFAKLQKTS